MRPARRRASWGGCRRLYPERGVRLGGDRRRAGRRARRDHGRASGDDAELVTRIRYGRRRRIDGCSPSSTATAAWSATWPTDHRVSIEAECPTLLERVLRVRCRVRRKRVKATRRRLLAACSPHWPVQLRASPRPGAAIAAPISRHYVMPDVSPGSGTCPAPYGSARRGAGRGSRPATCAQRPGFLGRGETGASLLSGRSRAGHTALSKGRQSRAGAFHPRRSKNDRYARARGARQAALQSGTT